MKKNQSGFSAIEALLILVIVGIIGGTGWYVLQANKNTNNTLNNAGLGTAAKSGKKISPAPTSPADPTSSWTSYSSKSGKYSLKYPSTWAISPISPSVCGGDDSNLLLGGDSKSVGKYCADGGGQIYINSVTGDSRSNNVLQSKDWKNTTSTKVTVDGVQGDKQTGIANNQGDLLGSLPDGSIIDRYTFYVNGRTYTANYEKRDSYPDVQSDFDIMVTKTLKFSN
jgi:Tfp pilus assembly protein PilV